jgi:hypothetical protein
LTPEVYAEFWSYFPKDNNSDRLKKVQQLVELNSKNYILYCQDLLVSFKLRKPFKSQERSTAETQLLGVDPSYAEEFAKRDNLMVRMANHESIPVVPPGVSFPGEKPPPDLGMHTPNEDSLTDLLRSAITAKILLAQLFQPNLKAFHKPEPAEIHIDELMRAKNFFGASQKK